MIQDKKPVLVIIGGGSTGIEIAVALAEYKTHIVASDLGVLGIKRNFCGGD